MTSRPPVAPLLRRARTAVATVFFLNAVLYANLVPRLPEIKDRLDLTNAELGGAIAAMPVGSLLAALLAPALMRRLSSGRIASYGLVLLAAALASVPFAGTWGVLVGLMLVAGALDAVVDVAQNAHGFRVQRAYGRSIVHAFHGVWSIGAVAGGLLGSAAIALRVPLPAHMIAVAVVFGAVAVVAARFVLPGRDDVDRPVSPPTVDGATRRRGLGGRTVLMLTTLGVLAACGAFVEDAGSSWAALYLRGEVGAAPATAGLGFVALMVAMTVGRLTGDRAVDRWGQRRVTLTGGAAIALGMGFALAVPTLGTTLLGFALAGLGVATLVPAVMHTADELPGLPHGVGLTIVNWLLRVGFLVSPTVVGLVADASSLRLALLGVPLAGVLVVVLGRVLVGVGSSDDDEASATPFGGPPGAAPSGSR